MPRADGSFQVFSSDTIALILARTLNPDNVIFLSSVKGVYTRQPSRGENCEEKVLTTLSTDNVNSIYKSSSDEKDVSGGMIRKVTCALEISRYCKKCFIASGLDSGILSKLLKGESAISTLVTADK